MDKLVGYGSSHRGGMAMPPGTAFHRPAVRGRTGVWTYVPLMAALALRLASEPTADLSYFFLALYALLGRAHTVRALALSWLFTHFNPGLAPEPNLASIGRYAVLFAGGASILLHSRSRIGHANVRPLLRATLAIGTFVICHSILFSPMVDVSMLKGISWTLAMGTLLAAWGGLTGGERQRLSQELFWLLSLVLTFSLPLAALPVGYLRNGSGFQGILNQPQAFGPTIALLGAWTVSRAFGERTPAWWLIGLAGACVSAVLMSEARTAGLAMVAGIGLAVLLAPGLAGQSISRMVPGMRSERIWVVFGIALIVGVAMAPKIVGVIDHYITKSGRAEGASLGELYDKSRGRLIGPMLDNIAEHPLTGIGFGIASEPWEMDVSRDPFIGLPIGASVEKGVTPLMVFEELGAFGVVLIAFWVVLLLRGSARSGVAPFSVCLTALLLNMGEATLFSPGGFGLLLLILLGWAYASGQPESRNWHG